MRIECVLMGLAAFAGFCMGQPPEAPMPMPKPEVKPRVLPDKPHVIFVGKWEIVQLLRPVTPASLPIPKGIIDLRDDQTFTWTSAQGDTMIGTFQVIDQKLVLTRKTALGETFKYNMTKLDIVDGKVIRQIGANTYEEWTRIPPPKKN